MKMGDEKKATKYFAAVVIMVVVVFFVWFFSGRTKKTYEVPLPVVVVQKPQVATILSSVSFSGHVEARAMVPVVPLVGGTILEYPIKPGMRVSSGDLLARIDKEPFKQQMLQAKAAYTGYESSFVRVEGLYSAGAVTRQEYDTVKAQRDAAKAQYDLAVLQLGYADVTSPLDGTVLSAPLARGSVAGPQSPLAVVADLSDLVVRLDVPEKYFTQFNLLAPRMEVTVTRSGQGGSGSEECRGVVDTVAPYVDASSKTFEVVLTLKEAPATFRPGMYVKVNVVLNRYEDVLAIPLKARKTDGSVYVFNPDSMETNKGRVKYLVLEDTVADNEWLMVPFSYADTLFVVEGQGTVFDNQSVTAVFFEENDEKVSP